MNGCPEICILFIQQIDAVLLASLSVFRSSRLKKVFEVIDNQYTINISLLSDILRKLSIIGHCLRQMFRTALVRLGLEVMSTIDRLLYYNSGLKY